MAFDQLNRIDDSTNGAGDSRMTDAELTVAIDNCLCTFWMRWYSVYELLPLSELSDRQQEALRLSRRLENEYRQFFNRSRSHPTDKSAINELKRTRKRLTRDCKHLNDLNLLFAFGG